MFSQNSSLTIVVEGIADKNGSLKIGVFDSAENFKTKSNPVLKASLPIQDTMLKHTFKGIKNSILAVAVYHDTNGDEQLNKKKLGIPSEGIGFSVLKKIKTRPPRFEEVAFNLKNDTTIVIRLRYPKSK